MKIAIKKTRIGIVGCGAIGSRIAKNVSKDLSHECRLSGLFDINPLKSKELSLELNAKNIIKNSLEELIAACDFVIEAVNSDATRTIVKKALEKKRSVLAMSAGKLLNSKELFSLAEKNKCVIILPSGAISGLDAVKAASQASISSVTLTTRKPPSGFARSAHVRERGINLDDIRKETMLFDGDVDTAVKLFPENINVAATLALACGVKSKVRVRIITAPDFKRNSHEIDMTGDFGRMVTRTENVVCPDNPKTSYLAVLSAIQTLKQHFQMVKIGT